MDIRNLSENIIIKDLIIKIHDIQSKKEVSLDSKYISDLVLDYMDFTKVIGYFSFIDLYQIEKILNIKNETRCIIFYTDPFGNYVKREFSVTKIVKSRAGTSDGYTFYIQDVISYELSRIFKSKNYSNIKLSNVFNEYLKKYIKPILKIDYSFQETISTSDINIPGNISFFEFLINQLKKEGFIYYNTRNSFTIKNVKQLLLNNLPLNPDQYEETTEHRYYQYRIYEYYTNPKPKDLESVSSQSVFFDKTSKTLKVNTDHNIDTLVNKGIQNSQGSRYIGRNLSTPEENIANNLLDYVSNNSIDIYIPFNLQRTDLFRLFNVKINGVPGYDESSRVGNSKLSGLYVCLGFKDKLFGGLKGISQVKLGRFNNPDYK